QLFGPRVLSQIGCYVGALALLGWWGANRLPRLPLAICAVLLLFGDLLRVDWDYLPHQPRQSVNPATASIQWLQSHAEGTRVIGQWTTSLVPPTLPANSLLGYSISHAIAYESLEPDQTLVRPEDFRWLGVGYVVTLPSYRMDERLFDAAYNGD